MERTIAGYHRDEVGDWVAELDCGHNQHLRHRPPFQVRPWVLTSLGRAEHLGTAIECSLCDRAELPDTIVAVGSSPWWDEHSLPEGLRRNHRLPKGRWGLLVVVEGKLRFTANTVPPIEAILDGGSSQAIPPTVEHRVDALGHVRFSIAWMERPRERQLPEDEGGDAACWAHLTCPECGVLLVGGASHRPGCPEGGR